MGSSILLVNVRTKVIFLILHKFIMLRTVAFSPRDRLLSASTVDEISRMIPHLEPVEDVAGKRINADFMSVVCSTFTKSEKGADPERAFFTNSKTKIKQHRLFLIRDS